jgi:hypothetical protein
MANNAVSDQIRSRVEEFVDELSSLIRQSAMDTVTRVLGGETDGRRGGRRGATRLIAAEGRGRARPKGAKRSQDELERLTGRLLAYVKGNAGQRIEQIAKGMGVSTRELNLPAKKLLGNKSIRTKGQKRATQYFPK